MKTIAFLLMVGIFTFSTLGLAQNNPNQQQQTATGYPIGAAPQSCIGWNCAPGS